MDATRSGRRECGHTPAGIGEAAREAGFTYAGRAVPLNRLNRVPT